MNFFPTPVICLMLPLLVVGCSMQPGKDKLLPDGGDTTLELMQGVSARGHAYYGNGVQADYLGTPLVSDFAPNNSYLFAHVDELRRDFQQVPNPQIVAYVYPHLNDGEMPVPGYFTVFNLYERNHYALSNEGHRHAQ